MTSPMFFVLGLVAGVLGFIPLAVSMRMAHRTTSTQAMTVGFYALAGVAVSMVILVAGLILVGVFAKEGLIPFVACEVGSFLLLTIVYVFYRNVFAQRKHKK